MHNAKFLRYARCTIYNGVVAYRRPKSSRRAAKRREGIMTANTAPSNSRDVTFATRISLRTSAALREAFPADSWETIIDIRTKDFIDRSTGETGEFFYPFVVLLILFIQIVWWLFEFFCSFVRVGSMR